MSLIVSYSGNHENNIRVGALLKIVGQSGLYYEVELIKIDHRHPYHLIPVHKLGAGLSEEKGKLLLKPTMILQYIKHVSEYDLIFTKAVSGVRYRRLISKLDESRKQKCATKLQKWQHYCTIISNSRYQSDVLSPAEFFNGRKIKLFYSYLYETNSIIPIDLSLIKKYRLTEFVHPILFLDSFRHSLNATITDIETGSVILDRIPNQREIKAYFHQKEAKEGNFIIKRSALHSIILDDDNNFHDIYVELDNMSDLIKQSITFIEIIREIQKDFREGRSKFADYRALIMGRRF